MNPAKMTPDIRVQAKKHFLFAGKKIEELLPIEAATLSLHQILIEADFQLEMTGPIKESMGFWIERLCKRVVEPTSRRFVLFLYLYLF